MTRIAQIMTTNPVTIAPNETAMRLPDQPIRKHMSEDVVWVPPDATIEEAIDRVVERRIGCLCIIDPASHRLLGVISQLDLLSHLRPRLRIPALSPKIFA